MLDKLADLYRNGTKFVFITSLHPLNPSNRQILVSREMIGFYIAPVIELDASVHFKPYHTLNLI